MPWSAAALAVGALLAWVVLVWFAIRLGPDVKAGDRAALTLLVTATLGAMACLFLGLLQGTRLWNALRSAPPMPGTAPAAVRPVGGRRARR